MIVLAVSIALQAADLPSCDSLEYEGYHEDCSLMIDAEAGLSVSFDFGPDAEYGESAFVILQRDGETEQMFEASGIESFFYPRLEDLDGNGFADILVPLITGNVNTEMLVIMGGEGGYAVASRELGGYAFDPVVPGLFVVMARSSAAERYASFYTWTGKALDLEAAVAIVHQDEDSATCTLATGATGRGEDFYCAAVMSE